MKALILLLLAAFVFNTYASPQPGVPTPEDCWPQDACRPMYSDPRKLWYPPARRDLSHYREIRIIQWTCTKTKQNGFQMTGGHQQDVQQRCLDMGFQYSTVESVGTCEKTALGLHAAKITYACVIGGR